MCILSFKKTVFFSLYAMLLLFPSSLSAQFKLPEWEAGVTTLGGFGGQAPFWIISNNSGKYYTDRNAGAMEISLHSQKDTSRLFDYNYGIELYGRAGSNEDVWIHQGYAGVTYNNLIRLRAGMWEEVVGSKLPDISSGSIIWSGNARPMPKVEIGIPDYVEIPYTRGFAEIKGVLSHGWFEEGRYASNVWLHHKNIYIRIGGGFPLNFYYGINHYNQWAGSSPRQEEPYPDDFDAFLRVFFNRRANPDHPGSPEGWVINKIGNDVGSRNVGVDYNNENYSAGIYLQDVFEDGSGMRRQNFPDGLWGIWLSFKEEKRLLQAVTYEFLHTTHQSGPEHCMEEGLVGNDNYFNHSHYRSGWTYYGYTIGTPLITSTFFNENAEFGTENNRVIAHHLGLRGYLGGEVLYRTLLTLSRNLGTHSRPYDERRDQLSWMLELSRPVNFLNMTAGITLAADRGDMYGDNLAVMLSLKRRGVLSR